MNNKTPIRNNINFLEYYAFEGSMNRQKMEFWGTPMPHKFIRSRDFSGEQTWSM